MQHAPTCKHLTADLPLLAMARSIVVPCEAPDFVHCAALPQCNEADRRPQHACAPQRLPCHDLGQKIARHTPFCASAQAHITRPVLPQVIEAHYLFGVDYDNIDIVIHPQSIIHSMVETADSSVLAQVRLMLLLIAFLMVQGAGLQPGTRHAVHHQTIGSALH